MDTARDADTSEVYSASIFRKEDQSSTYFRNISSRVEEPHVVKTQSQKQHKNQQCTP
jgi:hypothetical protein